jgi:2-octaprenyl-6-methoxyphenol hydroxylase
MNPNDPAVCIVGGGPVGMALALALKRKGIHAVVFEARSREAVRKDARILALSHGTQQMLDGLGVWSGLMTSGAATPIDSVHVSHRQGLGRTRMRADELGVSALGYVLRASALIQELDAALTVAEIPYYENSPVAVNSVEHGNSDIYAKVGADGTARGQLFAWAEGAVDMSVAKTREYHQHAVLCTVGIEQPHQNIAYERFTDEGPLALLPLGKDYAVVLTCASAQVDAVLALADDEFCQLLQRRFGQRHRFVQPAQRVAYALGLRWRGETIGPRQVWLGNAAQTLHPVAGQGFNLALRDVWELADCVAAVTDPGDAAALAAYASGRKLDRQGTIGFTDVLLDTFASNFSPLRHARGAALLALDLLPPLRNFVARRMMFGARGWP